MRHLATILALLLAAALVAGAEPVASFRWDAETSTPRAQKVRVARGASLALVARLQSYGKPIALPPGAVATFCWQTNGMASAWWTTNAVAATNGTLRAVWKPSMDAGAREYSFFLRVETEGGIDYSARGGLSIDSSPGLSPAAAPALPEFFPFTPLALSGSAAAAAEPVALVRWEAETSSPQPFAVRTLRGESLALEPQLVTYRRRAELPAGASAVFCYQTNGMGSAWWTAPATARPDGLLRAVWTPQMDAGAAEYNFFFRVESSEGLDYSAHGGLRVGGSPGALVNEIPFPVRTIDFAAVAVTNAPWLLAESDPAFAEWARTNAVASQIGTLFEVMGNLDRAHYELDDKIQGVGRAATNYTDAAQAAALAYAAAVSNKLEGAVAAASLAATNYADAVRAYAVAVSNKLDAALDGKAAANHMHAASEITGLATVARTGNYSDLIGSPSIPATPSDIGAAAYSHSHETRDVNGLDTTLNNINSSLSGKADKVSGATSGNFARLDSNGNLTDSGKKTADFAAANHSHKLDYSDSIYTDQLEGTMFKANNKGDIVPAVAGTDYVVPANLVAVSNALDAAIRAAEPGNYATVSNRAMSALQGYTETDPTVPAWAKAANKPAYTASEVGALAVEADPVFAAWVATNVPSGGGGADMGEVTNLVTELLAEAPDATALAALKAIIADLWQRLDAIEHADGSDVLTAAEAEAIVNDRVAPLEAMVAQWDATRGAMPVQVTNDVTVTINQSQSGVSLSLSPTVETRYNTNNSNYSLGISSVSGTGANPCPLVLGASFASVSFPSGAIVTEAYDRTTQNYYRVYKLGGNTIFERIHP